MPAKCHSVGGAFKMFPNRLNAALPAVPSVLAESAGNPPQRLRRHLLKRFDCVILRALCPKNTLTPLKTPLGKSSCNWLDTGRMSTLRRRMRLTPLNASIAPATHADDT